MTKFSVEQTRQAIKMECKRWLNSTDKTNKAKNLRKCELMEQIISNMPDDVLYEAEVLGGRDFAFPNAGTMAEQVVKYWIGKSRKKNNVKSKGVIDSYAIINGKRQAIEIKTRITSNSYNSVIAKDNIDIVLVNGVGVWLIKAQDIPQVVDKKGHLPYNRACGEPMLDLMECLGYDLDEVMA